MKQILFTCEACGKGFTQQAAFSRHKNIHKKTEYKCDVCDKNFKTKPYLSQHKKTHFIITSKCNICNEEFSTRVALSNHLLQVHNYTNPKFICKYCKISFLLCKMQQHIQKCANKKVQFPICLH